MRMLILFESAVGYALFQRGEFDEIAQLTQEVRGAVSEFKRFRKVVELFAFQAFTTHEQALSNLNSVTQSKITEDLIQFLTTNLPKMKKKHKKNPKFVLAIDDKSIPSVLSETFPYLTCIKNEATEEIMRGVRFHFPNFLKKFQQQDLRKAQLSLGHAYSRKIVKHDVNRADKPVIHSIALLDQLDKDINMFVMRLKEWFSWHFPELKTIIPDNTIYTLCVGAIQNREVFLQSIESESKVVEQLQEITKSETKAQEIVEAAKISMGQEIESFDQFTTRIINFIRFREGLVNFLKEKMSHVAPNLSTLIGETIGARLISQAGSLTNLAKYPASTIQILGAEKALFRALKTGGNTPKYGLLYNCSFIGKAQNKDKGKISRFVANKCALASRIDCFRQIPTQRYGERLNELVHERLEFLQSGKEPTPNDEAMEQICQELTRTELKQKRREKRQKQLEKEQEAPSVSSTEGISERLLTCELGLKKKKQKTSESEDGGKQEKKKHKHKHKKIPEEDQESSDE